MSSVRLLSTSRKSSRLAKCSHPSHFATETATYILFRNGSHGKNSFHDIESSSAGGLISEISQRMLPRNLVNYYILQQRTRRRSHWGIEHFVGCFIRDEARDHRVSLWRNSERLNSRPIATRHPRIHRNVRWLLPIFYLASVNTRIESSRIPVRPDRSNSRGEVIRPLRAMLA